MKITGLLVAVLFAFFIFSTPALAGNPCGVNPCGMEMKDGHHKERDCKKEHYKKGYYKKNMERMSEHMGMMKEVLTILRDLNHKPTKAQKKRLAEMIERLEEKEKRMQEKMEHRKDM
jgi:hypothetical protein